MSDILIRGMEMPKTESEVLIIAIKSDGSVYPVRIDGEGQPMIFPNEEMKNRAVPIPPHGDLIDRNALYHNMFIGPDGKVFPDRDVDNFPHEMRFEDIKRFIRKAQTVIQTSE